MGTDSDGPVDTETRAKLPLDSLSRLGAALADRSYARRGVKAPDCVLRVAVFDDHTLVREGLRALLQGEPDMKVVGESGSGTNVKAMCDELQPDVVLMDIDMPGLNGIEATRLLMECEPRPRVLVLTMYPEDERLIAALQAGASGYLMKDAAERELADAIRAVAAGEVYVRPRVAQLLAANIRPAARKTTVDGARAKFAELSQREQSVLRLIAEGYNGPEIGRRLGITAKTVDTYKQRIQEKLSLSHRSEYVRFALLIGLLK